MSIKQWLRNWIMSNDVALATDVVKANRVSEEDTMLSFSIIKATNGYIVKASQYKPQQRGPDWQHQLYIVREDELVAEVITRIMAINALEK